MAEPARVNAADTGADEPEPGRPDPGNSFWADVRRAMITAARSAGLAVAGLADRPGDRAAMDMAELTRTVLQDLGEMSRRWVVEEKILAEAEKRAFEEGWQACLAARRRLGVIDGGRSGAG